MRKYSQSGILMQQYSQSGIKDKSLKMPVCEDFRFLALLNTYSVVKHAVLRNNFCRLNYFYTLVSHHVWNMFGINGKSGSGELFILFSPSFVLCLFLLFGFLWPPTCPKGTVLPIPSVGMCHFSGKSSQSFKSWIWKINGPVWEFDQICVLWHVKHKCNFQSSTEATYIL